MQNDGVKKTIIVSLLLCIVCSLLVSGAVVLLRPMQVENKALDIKKNLLIAAGLISSSSASKALIKSAYEKIEVKVIDLDSGEIYSDIDPENYDQKKAAKDSSLNKIIDGKFDVAKIKMREKYSKVYFVKKGEEIEQIILPVYGKGLWSTMYGFLALAKDTTTVMGFGFYDHGETPGLGGEVDNPRWKKSWIGKLIYDQDFKVIISIIKGKVNLDSSSAAFEIDGLSGATITSRGVEKVIHYWLGKDGFYNFLKKFRERDGGGEL